MSLACGMRDPRENLPDPISHLVLSGGSTHVGWMKEMLDSLCTIVDRHAAGRYQPSALPRVALYKDGAAPQPVAGVYQPMMALIVSGAKEIAIGDRHLRYDPASYFIATVELPASGCVKLDLPDQRYLAVSLDLDSELLASVLADVETEIRSAEPAFAVNPVTAICSTRGYGSFAYWTRRRISPRSGRFTNARSCTDWCRAPRDRSSARSHGRTAASRRCAARSR
jgi:hypothetical protein